MIRFTLFTLAMAALLGSSASNAATFESSDGVTIYFTVEGSGEPVVLIHGYGQNGGKNWRDTGVVNALKMEYQVITLDVRGHGKSGRVYDASGYGSKMAKDVVELLDHLKIDRAHVVGYSMGGFLTMKLIVDHPDRVITATLGGSGGVRKDFPLYEWVEEFVACLDRGLSFNLSLQATMHILNAAPKTDLPPSPVPPGDADRDPRALAEVVRSWRQLEVDDEDLAKNKVPTLVIYGDHEFKLALPYMRRLSSLLANSSVYEIKGANHMTTADHPEFWSQLKKFLADHPAL